MSEKANLIDIVSECCVEMLSAEQIQTLQGKLYLKLRDFDIVRRETALSTEFECDNSVYIKRFLAVKMVSGRSQKTIKRYKGDLQAFFRDCNKPMKQITTDDIRLYLAKRDQIDKVTKVTQKNDLLTLRSFFSTMVNEEIISRNPTAKIETMKLPEVVKDALTDLECEQLRRACKNNFDKALLETFLSTGCRVSEIAEANKTDIKGDTLKVVGKGNKERYVYLNARALCALEAYLSERKDSAPGLFVTYWDKQTAKLWNSQHSNKVKPGEPTAEHASKSTLETHIRKLGKQAGIEKVHPHRLRRTAATLALRRGMPIEQVSLMLGHANLETTRIYARSTDDDVHLSHKKYLA